MSYDYDSDYVIQKCRWKPTSGKLYQCFDSVGFIFSEKPIVPYSHLNLGRLYAKDHGYINMINHGDIFMYLGGRQSIPDHYTFFRILFGERALWLIYPERWHRSFDRPPIDPLRL